MAAHASLHQHVASWARCETEHNDTVRARLRLVFGVWCACVVCVVVAVEVGRGLGALHKDYVSVVASWCAALVGLALSCVLGARVAVECGVGRTAAPSAQAVGW